MLYWTILLVGLGLCLLPKSGGRVLSTLQRFGGVLLTVAVVHAATHVVMKSTPGGPFDAEAKLDPQVKKRLEAAALRGADTVSGSFAGLWAGDGTPSLALRDFTAAEVLREGARRSFSLGMRALVLAIVIGSVLGIAAGVRGGLFDRVVVGATSIVPAVPVFAWAAVLVAVFATWLKMLPPAALDGRPPHLPVVAAAAAPAAMIARLVRDELRRNRDAMFARAASARGAGPLRRLLVHVLPQSLVPAVAFIGPAAASLLTGTLAVEAVFGIPGLGAHLVQGALARDLPVVCGATTLYAAALGLFGLVADVLAERLDPRRSAA